MIDIDCLSTTEQEAYSMSVSVALHTLNEIMTDDEAPLEQKRWAAEAVLNYKPKADYEKKTDDDDDQD